jgi:hypothetical protein
VSRSDNFAVSRKQNTKLKHIISHSRHREWFLSKLMRPWEALVVLFSPLFFAGHMVSGGIAWIRSHLACATRPARGNQP